LNGTLLTSLFLFAALLAVTDHSTVSVTVTVTGTNVTGTTVSGTTVTSTTSIATMSDGSDSDERSMIFDGEMFVSSRLLQAEEWEDLEDFNVPWLDAICFDLGTQDSSSSSSSSDSDFDDTDLGKESQSQSSLEYDVKEDIKVPWLDKAPAAAAAAGTKGSTPPAKDPQLPKRIFQPDMKLYRKKVTLDPSSKWTLDRDKFIKDFEEHWEVLTGNQKIAYTHVLFFLEERTTHRETSKGRYGEWHHILPKSLGGSDNDENMIWLECGEFFVHMK